MFVKYPFPFIGVSRHACSTSLTLNIKFHQDITDDMKERIISDSPKIIELDYEYFKGKFINIKKFEGVHADIQEKYGAETDGLLKFQNEINEWLLVVNTYWPIEIAVQPDYNDNIDAEFSDWHIKSCQMSVAILEKWLKEPEKLYRSNDEEFSHLSVFVEEITSYLHEPEHQTLIESVLKIYNPQLFVDRLIDNKDNNQLLKLIGERQNDIDYLFEVMNQLNSYIEDVVSVSTKIEQSIYHLVKHLVAPENQNSIKYINTKILVIATHVAFENEDGSLVNNLKILIKSIKSKHSIVNYLMYFTYERYMKTKKWNWALLQYEFIFEILAGELPRNKDYSIYCNALYVLQDDVTGSGVQHERNKRILAVCLPVAPDNPAIYFNAATLYVEMGDHENALLHFKHYFSSNDKDKAMLLAGLETENMYIRFREYENVGSYLLKVRTEIG